MNLSDVRRTYGKVVTHKGIRYRLDACIERPASHGGYTYAVEMHDLKAPSCTIAKLEEVEIAEQAEEEK